MKVGVIGTGQMGGGMAKNLIEKGFSVVVYDLRSEVVEKFIRKGATAATSAKELGNLCDVVLASLPTSPQSPALEHALLGPEGVLEGMVSGKIILDCGNTSPLVAQKIDAECKKKGVFFLDTPVSGGQKGAEEGTLSIMVGGQPGVFERVKAIFNAIGQRATFFGPCGSGQLAKIINNMVVHAHIAIMSEAFALGTKAGLDAQKLFDALSAGQAQSRVLDTFGKNLLERSIGQKGTTNIYPGEQLIWALQIARELAVPVPVTSCVQELYKMTKGLNKKGNYEQILELWEDMTGVFFSKFSKPQSNV